MTAILGISAYYHDSAAALVVDGEILAAAQEERFTRVKHDSRFPSHAISYCLREAGLRPEELDFVGFYEKPLLKFDRLLETYLAFAPSGFRSFARAMPTWLGQKLHLGREMRRELAGYRRRFVFTEHHESHAASAFFPSPFEEAAILTLDGVGEWATATIGAGRGNRIEMLREQRFPHSLGLLYSAFTSFLGFKVNSGEYKLMGLAPYGVPRYADLILAELVDLKEDGSLRLDLSYFPYCHDLRMTSKKLARLFGRPPRRPGDPITDQDRDIAASIQKVTETAMLRAARTAHRLTGSRNLCLAGGVALNCVGNGVIRREGPFERIWIQPAAGDSGGALGVALFIWHQLLGRERRPAPADSQRGSLLGPAFDAGTVRAYLDRVGAAFTRHEPSELYDTVARALAAGGVVGWIQGRMEFGPRALGSRSILGDPRDPRMQSVMNQKIKFRESFRPFAPAVLEEKAAEWFELEPGESSPYMLLTAPVREERRRIPAVTHVDHSARVQTVDRERSPRFHELLRRFEAASGVPVLINTSFNVRGEPIVCTPEDAFRCFMATDMDMLVIEDLVLRKDEQPAHLRVNAQALLSRFEPD